MFTNSNLYALRCCMVSAWLLVVTAAAAHAQQSNVEGTREVDITVGVAASIQPAASGTGSPYLDHGVGGTVPGFNAAAGVTSASGVHVSFELSSGTTLAVLQRGRFVDGSRGQPALATHRDTLVSILPGFRFRLARGSVETKGGISLRFGETRREGTQPDGSTMMAFTGGIDGVVRLSARVAIVPALRYSYVFRGDDAFYFGLSSHIFRPAIGLRVTVGR